MTTTNAERVKERVEKKLRLIADKLDILNGRARKISMEELRQKINWAVKDIWVIADEVDAILSSHAALQAENERLASLNKHVSASQEYWCKRSQKAEAELAEQRPLIEAAKKARRSTLGEDRVFWGVDEDAILRANLDYRNKTEKKGE